MRSLILYISILGVLVHCMTYSAMYGQGSSTESVVKVLDGIRRFHNSPRLSFRYDMRYRLYSDHAGDKLLEEKIARYQKDGDRYYLDMFGDMEVVSNDSHTLTARHKDRRIQITRRDVSTEVQPFDPSDMAQQLEELQQEFGGSCQVGQRGNGVGYIEINLPYSEFRRYVLDYDLKSYRMVRMVAYYRSAQHHLSEFTTSPPRLEVLYENYREGSASDQTLFSLKRFGELRGNDFVPQERYRKYQIINKLKQP